MHFRSQSDGAASNDPAAPRARVVVTGVGIVTALGHGWKANARGFRDGRPGFRCVSLFDVSRQRTKTAAEADLSPALPATQLSRKQEKRLDRASKLLLIAAHEAWRQSGWDASTYLPVILGTTSGGMSRGEAYYRHAINTPRRHRGQPTRALHYLVSRQGLDLAEAFGFQGSITTIANACASGTNAVGHAWHLVASRQASRVLTGGYDALSQLVFAGFDSLQALSPTHCRPFDAHRDGLALGEGAAVLCLETLEDAQARGAIILGEIAGYGASTDCHHLTQPHPQGDAAFQAMTLACQAAGIDAAQINYINAHGTGTPLNDSAEAEAINRLLGEHAPSTPVSSTKSSVGHLLGAAGAVEAAVCLMALREQWLPPTTSLQTPDPVCAFPLVQQPVDIRTESGVHASARPPEHAKAWTPSAALEFALSNSFGFGGANATLILRRWR